MRCLQVKRILISGFEGNDNSSKILLDKIQCKNKLYLENDFRVSEQQLKIESSKKTYDKIIIFGQKPLIKKIYIEICAKKESEIYNTNYNYSKLEYYLTNNNYKSMISNDAGNYLCNNIYFYALGLLKNSEIIFIHIPTLKNIEDIDNLANIFSRYVQTQ